MLRWDMTRLLDWQPFTAATLVFVAVSASSFVGSVSCGPRKDANADAGPEEPVEPGCPSDPPAQESRCGEVSRQCEYGTEHRVMCNTVATCTDLGWIVVPPDERCTPNDEGCPESSFEIERGAECSLRGILCSYSTATCACDGVAGPGGSDFTFKWSCTDGPELCPPIREHLGSRCFEEGQVCSYGGCGLVVRNITQSCVGGRWERVDDACGDASVSAGDAGSDVGGDGAVDAPKTDAAPGG
jgi:hypothetical protein